MENNNPNKDEYYYTLFESGNKGFVLKEEFEPRKFQYQLTEEFFDFVIFPLLRTLKSRVFI